MNFNKGFLCPNCGPVQESKKRSIAKVQYTCCKICDSIVSVWEKPINERSGHCGNCGKASFKSKIVNHNIHRECKNCFEVYDIDSEKVVKNGMEEKRYGIKESL